MPYQPPWSDVGDLQRKVDHIERELNDKAEHHEIYTINNRLDNLELSLREISAKIDEYSYQLQALQEKANQLEIG